MANISGSAIVQCTMLLFLSCKDAWPGRHWNTSHQRHDSRRLTSTGVWGGGGRRHRVRHPGTTQPTAGHVHADGSRTRGTSRHVIISTCRNPRGALFQNSWTGRRLDQFCLRTLHKRWRDVLRSWSGAGVGVHHIRNRWRLRQFWPGTTVQNITIRLRQREEFKFLRIRILAVRFPGWVKPLGREGCPRGGAFPGHPRIIWDIANTSLVPWVAKCGGVLVRMSVEAVGEFHWCARCSSWVRGLAFHAVHVMKPDSTRRRLCCSSGRWFVWEHSQRWWHMLFIVGGLCYMQVLRRQRHAATEVSTRTRSFLMLKPYISKTTFTDATPVCITHSRTFGPSIKKS